MFKGETIGMMARPKRAIIRPGAEGPSALAAVGTFGDGGLW